MNQEEGNGATESTPAGQKPAGNLEEACSSFLELGNLQNRREPQAADLSGRLVVLMLLLTALLDYLFYLGKGGMSYAIAALVVPAALLLVARPRRVTLAILLFIALFLLFAARAAWQNHPLTGAMIVCSLVCFAIILRGDASVFLVLTSFPYTALTGCGGWLQYGLKIRSKSIDIAPETRRTLSYAIGVPFLVVFAFAFVFILANPVLQQWVQTLTDWSGHRFSQLWELIRPDGMRILFWIICLWFLGGLFRPWLTKHFADCCEKELDRFGQVPLSERLLYAAAVNTLVAVNLLFLLYNAVDAYYLVYRHELPTGINHSQYAHQGSLWLTIALAMTTYVLGVVFSGVFRLHPRIHVLNRLAAIWLAQNLMLAWWVCMRVHMYVEYNGLTRMRLVALFGTAAVIAGLCLVAMHIRQSRTLSWLVGRQITALFSITALLAITPLDAIVWNINVRLLMSGKAPKVAVQLAVQPISPEGLMALPPLLEHADPVIAQGTAALLGNWYYRDGHAVDDRRWTKYQFSHTLCRRTIARYEASINRLIPNRKWAPHRDRLRSHTARWI